ncbi:MAG: TVP38/TMEM64 family protein [Candidatus Thermoplasmatota archaeon]|jgi:uncharacterized membrane protein YdjX (TVP38/TMEM64 family)|nr:TVP38/TMEM64 family protein [Candidatus Thermoplasmatota archaeon]MDP7264497.1 TVP38/TMEM64 family protein [Candidatus Thermoplasmatota archaeon]
MNNNSGNENVPTGHKRKKHYLFKPLVLILLILTVYVIVELFGLDERLDELRDWIGTLGVLGLLVYIGIYIIATVAFVPGSLITIAAGVLFGSFLGVIVVSIGSTVGASLSFLIGRYFAKDAVERWMNKNEKFRKMEEFIESHGQLSVAIVRLIPLFPYNLVNYGFGLTRVRFRTYVLWTWLCMLPVTIIYVVGADAVTSGITKGEVPWILIIVIIVITLILTLLIIHTRRVIKDNKKNESETQLNTGEGISKNKE